MHCDAASRHDACSNSLPWALAASRIVRKRHLGCSAFSTESPVAPLSQVSEEERVREVRAEATRRIKALGAQRKLKEAIQELAGLSKLGVQPDTQAATALVAACAQSGNMDMAESVFEQLFGE